ncbi:hypothetical protein PAHAL_6G039100 [Panicum hallii]|uniref:Uncharacterized protein n=1 Tax=Panicum hallii TaxID=206008 RepID=A0A2T8IF78_9POAL|nr:hypothetical protein PAHAL_6G039100 [Panicum hallii]
MPPKQTLLRSFSLIYRPHTSPPPPSSSSSSIISLFPGSTFYHLSLEKGRKQAGRVGHGVPVCVLLRDPAAAAHPGAAAAGLAPARRPALPLLAWPRRAAGRRRPPGLRGPAAGPLGAAAVPAGGRGGAAAHAGRHQGPPPRRPVRRPPPGPPRPGTGHVRRVPGRARGAAPRPRARQLCARLPQGVHRQVGRQGPGHLPALPRAPPPRRARRRRRRLLLALLLLRPRAHAPTNREEPKPAQPD